MIDRVTTVAAALGEGLGADQTWMVGGFGRGGVPFTLLAHVAAEPARFCRLTLVKNDANEPELGIGRLLAAGQVERLVSTHLGLNPAFIAQMNRGEVACELIPQGIFAERIRAGGAGIPAFLTDVGEGTEVGGGETVELDGRAYRVERALTGDVALLGADVVDRGGNCWWRGSNRNMCVVMGMACRRVLVEAKQIVEVGEIRPEDVHLPGVFVDAVVPAQPEHYPGGREAAWG